MPAGSSPADAKDSAKDGAKRKNFPLRGRTGTAAHHLKAHITDIGTEFLEKLTPREAVMFMAEASWGSTTFMPCPHCGSLDEHYFRAKELRWKCTSCGKTFSVTSGTVLADRKLPLTKILKMALSWANGASGKPALQLRRDWQVSYTTVFTLAHKLREGLLRGFNIGILAGVQEMDGADQLGRRYKEKRNKPRGGDRQKPTIPEHLRAPTVDPDTGEILGPPKPPKFDKAAKQPEDRRLMLVIRQRGLARGRGAVATRVGIALTESRTTVTTMATRYASSESHIMTDEDPSYSRFATLFAEHRTVNHSQAYSDRKGTNNNQAESFNWRMKRLVRGIYLNPSVKYLLDYAGEAAWREDTRRLSVGDRLKHLLKAVMGVGLSRWWRNYSHGHHREEELLLEGAREAGTRGKEKGWKPKPPR
ncbi:IS1595 family transposase [Ideonella sp. DXS22W]|uniref:IS1595 family transposase n=1 Tax=Pseudaquabacterium inlustre TaxID=2984192 RepID=A0ABU9CBP2_9BURK